MLGFSVDQIVEGVSLLLGLGMTLLTLYFIFKRKTYKSSFDATENTDDLESIDYKALHEAEAVVAKMDIRAELAKNYTRIKDFSNMYGFDENFMVNLVLKLKEKDIAAEYIFVPAMPTGVASYVGNAGTWELFVMRDKEEQAIEWCRQWGISI